MGIMIKALECEISIQKQKRGSILVVEQRYMQVLVKNYNCQDENGFQWA